MAETDAERKRRFQGWLVFGLLASLVPILWIALKLVFSHRAHGWEVVSGGDLITVGFVLALGAAGDLLVRRTTQLSAGDLWRVGITFLLAVCGGWLYAMVSLMNEDDNSSKCEPGVITLGTFAVIIFFGATNVWAKDE
ncbi:hypothetical protein [Mycobacterium sp. E2733]|uniref:hypothetical protein n=1 Tax=Mycobacterium sp. E2733 TaxID=1834138 RepID=UPI0012EA6CC3|nr:hypothetical protein [Mycobacterium sp. E2733]